ncbi:hypothetical protein [Pseudomonas syringae]|uniref:hypothetical protein n=1 Tax=Pseudomonas syringae TaxID=317 RepID=UPI0010127CD4|nr:hypothetical protein [Pseudomonas syringae]RXT62602.1 hypothetical protein B1F71_23800 [Pseudomonas syringae]RXT98126.1 hypothetical protein B1F75_01625 [Pseudomonas syringae]
MRSQVTPHTMQELASDFDAAVEWVGAIGFPIQRGRILEYQRILSGLADRFEIDGWGNLEDQAYVKQLCTVLIELRELVSIYRGLSVDSDPDGLRDMRLYVKGPFSPVDESQQNSSNRARNIGFEFYLTALCAYANLKPIYGTQADLCFNHDGHTYFVEAKRPLYSHSVHAAIKDANKQLSRRIEGVGDGVARGLIALDLSKVINPNDRVMQVFGVDHLDALMNGEAAIQIETLKNEWHANRHAKTVGVLLCFKLLTQFQPTGDFNTLRWITFVQFEHDSNLVELGQRLQAVIRHIC